MSLSNLLARAHKNLVVFSLFSESTCSALSSLQDRYILFFSLSNGSERAWVCRGSGADFSSAWKQGAQRCQTEAKRRNVKVQWLRIDWVKSVEETTWGELSTRLARTKRNYFRFGISLDIEINHAFLEPELGANAMFYLSSEKAEAGLNEKNFTVHAQRRFGQNISLDFSPQVPVWLFTHEGAFFSDDPALEVLPAGRLDGNGSVWLSGPSSTKNGWRDPSCLNAGHRQIDTLQINDVFSLVKNSSDFLARQVKKNGQFIYGLFPCFGRTIPTYNALRHASSIYSMLEAWELTQSEELLEAIKLALHYLVDKLVHRYTEDDGVVISFNVDVNDEIKLGANAVSLLALVKYDELTGDKQYRVLMEELALGIKKMQDPDSGQFVHVLNATNLSVKESFRIVYYDGEAAFGLMRLYGLTKDPRWLAMVEHAFEYFLHADHWKHHDHWLSYCVNELTLYKPEEKYFRFGVRNIAGYLNFILKRETTYPTLLELSMAFDAMLRRIQNDFPHMSNVLKGLNIDSFYRALHHRAHYLLNGFFWPELAMYYAKPQSIVGSFFIRHHSFRVRIDDIEHYLSGYVAYWKMLHEKRPKEFRLATLRKLESAQNVSNYKDSPNWNQVRLLRATGGRWLVPPINPGWSANGLCIWRPSMQAGQFVAIRPENWKGGVPLAGVGNLPFLPQALIVQQDHALPADILTAFPVLEVNSINKAILDIGHYARSQLLGRVVGVTGSAGKTTLVAMLVCLLRPWGDVGSTQHNANLPHGIAWNLASIPWGAPHIVLEMAIGRMHQNASMAQPDVAVFTNIAPAHLEYHGSTAEVARKKARIFDGMAPGSVAVINRDMEHWSIVAEAANARGLRILYYGEHQSAEVRLLNYDPESCRVSAWLPSGEVNYRMGAPGLHMALNSVACLAVVEALGLTAALAIKQFPHFQPLPGRGEVLDLKSNERKLRVIDESYNANPISMRAALQLVREYSLPRTLGRRVLILGDMLELGPDALELHQALDEAVLAVAPDLVLLCGSEMRGLFDILRERCNVRWYAGAQEINREIPELLADGDIVLVKGSAGTGLSSTVNELKNRKW